MDEDEIRKRIQAAHDDDDPAHADQPAIELFAALADWTPPPRTAFDDAWDAYKAAAVCADWPAAEAALRDTIRLDEQPMRAWRSWHRLVGVQESQGRSDDAYATAQRAADVAREADLEPLLTNSLVTLARMALKVGDRDQALAAVEEGLAVVASSNLFKPWNRAPFLVERANLRLADGDLDACDADLAEAEPLLTPFADSMMAAGVLSTLGLWHRVRAELFLRRGDRERAAAAAREAYWLTRRIGEMPHLEAEVRRGALIRGLAWQVDFHERAGLPEVAEAMRREVPG